MKSEGAFLFFSPYKFNETFCSICICIQFLYYFCFAFKRKLLFFGWCIYNIKFSKNLQFHLYYLYIDIGVAYKCICFDCSFQKGDSGN